jgi:photosystem II stability/assembly factor-like uncharacterized protein
MNIRAWILVCIATCSGVATAEAAALRLPVDRPAQRVSGATGANIVATAHAGPRIVAVGDHGVVLLSDDGRKFRQAAVVPVQSTLTDVSFVDARHGWAVGHDGVVLASEDGGEHWRLQRRDAGLQPPLLGVWFEDLVHGFAVGQFGRVIETRDGGSSWTDIAPVSHDSEYAEQHYNAVTGNVDGLVVIVGERGLVLSSRDHGRSWSAQATGQNGSLWNVRQLRDGTLIAAGIRGHLYRSEDLGAHWTRIADGTTESLTGITELDDGSVLIVGYGGTLLSSTDHGKHFSGRTREDRLPLSTVIGGSHGPVLFAVTGLVPQEN